MTKLHPFLLLFLLLLPLSTASPPPNNAPSLPISSTSQQDNQQLNNIIDALIGAGDFSNWADMLSSAIDSAMFPLSATFFIPREDFPSTLHVDPFIFGYHIVPQRLSFSDLRLLKPFSRLPTLLPAKSILITNTSLSNFTIDNSLLSHPDLYLTSTIAVHGVQTFFDYSVYGGNSLVLPQPLSPPPPPPPRPRSFFVPAEDQVTGGGGGRSDAAPRSCCWEFQVLFLVVCGVLAFKIYEKPLGV